MRIGNEDAQRRDEDAWLSGEGVRGGDKDARDGGVGAEIRNEGVQGEGARGSGEGRQSVGVRGGDVDTRDGGMGVQSGNEGSRGEDVTPRRASAYGSSTFSVSSEAKASAHSGVSCDAKVFSFSMKRASLQPRGVPGAFAKPPVITGESVSFLQK